MSTPNTNNLPLDYFIHGLPLIDGECATLLYFAVGGKESLYEDPFNQPVDIFLDGKTRVISVDLPFHGEDFDKLKAMKLWSLAVSGEDDIFAKFILQVEVLLEDLKSKGFINPEKFAIAGLSRGGFLASHVAAHISWIKYLLAFAPVTNLEKLSDFENLTGNRVIHKWSLMHQTEQLAAKHLRFYIGNMDTCVDTDACYTLLRSVVRKGKAAGIRSPQTEMVMYPSIGYKGHGTPPHIFEEGITWLKGFMEY